MNEKTLSNNKTSFKLDQTIVLVGMILLGVHYGLVKVSESLAFENGVFPVWPSSGIFLAAILILGYRVTPAIVIADLIVQYFAYNSVLATIIFSALDIWDALATAFLIQRFIRQSYLLDRAQSVFRFVILLLFSPLLSSTLSSVTLCLLNYSTWENYWQAWWSWYNGIVLGELILTPVLLAVAGRAEPIKKFSAKHLPELALLVGLAIVIAGVAFGGIYPVEYIILPVLFWAAFRFGQRETMPLVLGVSAIAVWQTAKEVGPFVRPSSSESLMLVQTFMGVVTLSILVFSAVMSQNRQAEKELKHTNTNLRDTLDKLQHTQGLLEESNQELEHRVEQRTAELYEARAAAEAAKVAAESARATLQSRAIELLQDVSPVQQGDLTVQLRITPDEIGTLADSYNAIISSLRAIIMQVQTAAEQVVESAHVNENSVQELSMGAARQAEAIEQALQQIEQLEAIVQQVSLNTRQAESAVRQANLVVQEGDAVMNQTVQEIQALQVTVAKTANKIRQLDKSSQTISTIVSLINKFAAQTHMLAINTSIEASRAGEHGKGFQVIATEVQELAGQSAKAVQEIQALIHGIQEETREVVTTMEASYQQVVTGTQLVNDTRQNLNQITAASQQINELVKAIAQATVTQSRMSGTVTEVMKNIAAIANKTSDEANHVSMSSQELRQVAQGLQDQVEQFKLN